METPWGHADFVERITAGFCSVGTPSHGGFHLTARFAQAHLSEAARAHAYPRHVEGEPYWYEEDLAWMIVAWELREYWGQIFQWMKDLPSDSEREEYLLKSLSYWEPDYLRGIGVAPIAEREQAGRWDRHEEAAYWSSQEGGKK